MRTCFSSRKRGILNIDEQGFAGGAVRVLNAALLASSGNCPVQDRNHEKKWHKSGDRVL